MVMEIESKQDEHVVNRSFDIIYNYKNFLNSRTYSYEKESNKKILLIKKVNFLT